MLKQLRPFFLVTIGLAIAFISGALTLPFHAAGQTASTATAMLSAPSLTSTPTAAKEMIPGSTSLILLLGTLLVVIIVASIMWHRRDWERK
jgi:hypothetical protein